MTTLGTTYWVQKARLDQVKARAGAPAGPLLGTLGYSGVLARLHEAELTTPARKLLADVKRARARLERLMRIFSGSRLSRQLLSKTPMSVDALVRYVLKGCPLRYLP